MKRLLITLAAAAAPAIAGPSAPAKAPVKAAAKPSTAASLASLELRARELEGDLAARARLLDERRKAAAGGRAAADLAAEDQAVQSLYSELAAVRYRLASTQKLDQRVQPLFRTVDVELKNATFSQAGQALSRAAGIRVEFTPEVAVDRTISLKAKAVDLATVLETIATQSDLIIAPVEGGVQLRPWPTLELNGAKRALPGGDSPWAEEWGGAPTRASVSYFLVEPDVPPAHAAGVLRGAAAGRMTKLSPFAGQGGPASASYRKYAGRATAVQPPSGGALADANRLALVAPAQITFGLSSVGDRRVVLSTPGTGPDQRTPGTWFTFYKLEGGELKVERKSFQAGSGTSSVPPRDPQIPPQP